MLMAACSFQNVGVRRGDRFIIREVSGIVEAGGILGLAGPNGVGKTTLLRCIAQLHRASEGSFDIAGEAFGPDASAHANSDARQRCGMQPHEPLAWDEFTVEQNLELAARLSGAQLPTDILDAHIRAWNLAPVRTTRAGELSRGWKQRYSLCRAGINSPQVVLLDEPTTALDAGGRELLDSGIARWAAGGTAVIIASHDREWLSGHADAVLELATADEVVA